MADVLERGDGTAVIPVKQTNCSQAEMAGCLLFADCIACVNLRRIAAEHTRSAVSFQYWFVTDWVWKLGVDKWVNHNLQN